MNFKLFGKTILVVNIKFDFFWAIHSASELRSSCLIHNSVPRDWLKPLAYLKLSKLLCTGAGGGGFSLTANDIKQGTLNKTTRIYIQGY